MIKTRGAKHDLIARDGARRDERGRHCVRARFALVRRSNLALFVLALISACAEVERTPSRLTPAPALSGVLALEIAPQAREATGFADVFAPGSEWELVGRIAEGVVLRPVDGGLGVKGIHVREAYAVVRDDRLVGFWLPFEEAYSPAHTAVPVSFR